MKHIHYDFILAWAAGEDVEFQPWNSWKWFPVTVSSWDVNTKFRMKPLPTPDVVIYSRITNHNNIGIGVYASCPRDWSKDGRMSLPNPNLKSIFDGDTGQLKSAEIIK